MSNPAPALADTPASAPAQSAQPATNADHLLLMDCALIISSFRWKLREAGYPFPEPPNTQRTIARIDAVCFPDEKRRKPAKTAANNSAAS